MPNWCEGCIKVRGKPTNIVNFVKNALTVYDYVDFNVRKKNDEGIDVEETDHDVHFDIKETTHIEGTRRHFVEKNYVWIDLKKEVFTICMPMRAAWRIDSEPLVILAQKYGVDIRVNGYEMGMEFNQEIIIENGEVVKAEVIEFGDYRWECPMPTLGG